MAGEPSHIEIGVPDLERAKTFYASLLGWKFEDTKYGSRITAGSVGGGMHHEETPSSMIFYSVPDLDGAIARVIELGGEVDEGRGEGPGGRYAYTCRDDQGLEFGLHEPPSA